MTLKQLEYALAVEDTGSVCAAATRLHVAQPSLSQQLLTLERELGVPLFERTPKGTVPSKAGRAFLIEARAVIEAAARAREAAAGADAAMVIVVQRPVTVAQVQDALGDGHAGHVLVIPADDGDDLAQRVTQDDVDLAIGPLPGDDFVGETRGTSVERGVVVLAAGDDLLKRDVVALGDLAHRRRIRPRPLRDAWHHVDTVGDIIETDTVADALRLAAAGVGWVLVPAAEVDGDIAPLVRPLDVPVLQRIGIFAAGPFSAEHRAIADAVATAPWN